MNNEIENIISHIQPEEDSEKMLNYIEELEQQNKEMLGLLKMISEYFDKGQHNNLCEAIFNKDIKQIIT